jgi:Protein of unknown function (DUF1761)
MELISVLVAAVAAFAYGAVHYTVFSKQWLPVSGVPLDENGRPAQGGNMLFEFGSTFVALLFVAGMMRHMLAMSGVATLGGSVVSAVGVGAFFIVPWVWMNNTYTRRPIKLTVIDGAYSIIGCAIIGAVLALL